MRLDIEAGQQLIDENSTKLGAWKERSRKDDASLDLEMA